MWAQEISYRGKRSALGAVVKESKGRHIEGRTKEDMGMIQGEGAGSSVLRAFKHGDLRGGLRGGSQ